MRLVVTTPTEVVAETGDVVAVRAEDASGLFGILDGHADLLTVLAISVLSWRGRDGRERHCAVRGGVLTVTGGDRVAVATREAVASDDLDRLEREVLERFRETREAEQGARAASERLHLAAIRRMLAYLRPERAGRGLEASRLYGAAGDEG